VLPSRNVQARGDGPVVGTRRETGGYRDTGVDSPFFNNVGGLEMWIGSKGNKHYLVGESQQITATQSGELVFRTIDSLRGFRGTGAFSVSVNLLK